MTTESVALSRTRELLGRVERPPGAAAPVGAGQEQLAAAEARLGAPLPPSLRTWLQECNGVVAGPGVLFGVGTAEENLDLFAEQALWPSWQDNSWLPVASDGTGNSYVVDAAATSGGSEYVYFVDCGEDPDALTYAVASSVPIFVMSLLAKDLGESAWPFDQDEVLRNDPKLAQAPGAPLPWDA